jgi:hypothetical protein
VALIALLYIIISSTLLVYCYRSVASSLLSIFLTIFIKSIFQLLISPISLGALKVFLGGATEELLRSITLKRFGVGSSFHLAIVSGVIYAAIENTRPLTPFFGDGLFDNMSFRSILLLYDQSDANIFLVLSVIFQPFARLILHFLFIYTALEALRNRMHSYWAGTIILHGILNVLISELITVGKYPETVGLMVLFSLLFILINRSMHFRIHGKNRKFSFFDEFR